MEDPVFLQLAFDLDSGEAREKVLQRNNLVRQSLSGGDGVFDPEVP
jgi:hypothetical protein